MLEFFMDQTQTGFLQDVVKRQSATVKDRVTPVDFRAQSLLTNAVD
jgi:hypothetical protein